MSLGRLQNRLGALIPRLRCVGGGAIAALVTVLAVSGDAQAGGPVTPTGKGIVGGALLGGEVVIIPMGAAGLNRGWPYFVFGGVGMVGGAIGGYFVEKATAVTVNGNTQSGGPAEPALYMLAGGMALIIPALVLALNATAYKPPEGDRAEPANNEPVAEPPQPAPGPAAPGRLGPAPGTTYRYRAHPRGGFMATRERPAVLPHIPVSLLDVYGGKVAFGVPALEVRPLYTQAEMFKYGVGQGTEVRLPVFKAMF